MDMNMSPSPAAMTTARPSYMHMTLYWSKNSVILFKNFPRDNTGHYILALIMVFAFTAGVEYLNQCYLIGPRWQRTAAELARTALHTIRMGLYYLAMLSLMSFNGGVLLVAILGHAAVFLGQYTFASRSN